MSFQAKMFLAALVAAAGPLLIHLLNRRRRRTIYWAAMDFLREAIKRNRRILQLRDVILLLLRTAVVVLFVLAMARPFWAASQDDSARDRRMHAVLVIDNSLSMGYTQLDKSLLAVAKDKAKTFIESLPKGSEISVIPLCSYSQWHARDVYATQEDAREALDRIQIVDRSTPVTVGFTQAQRACRLASDIPTKRVVFIGDVQRRTWSFSGVEPYLAGISDIQVVQVSPPRRTNTWVSEFRLLHGIADTDSTAVFRATIRHEGEPRNHVRVTLKIDDAVAVERYVDLVPGHNLQLDFDHRFDVAGTSAEPLFVPATLELSPDRLPMDDQRTVIVPVVERVPVVFIDQYGPNERPQENLFGETARVRRLMDSGSEGGAERKHLVQEILRTIDQVTRDDLKEARLVVIAGVKAPAPEAVGLLREYVEQGGNILLGAGADFDPAQWTLLAWRDGAGILPAPLSDTPIGKIPQPNETKAASFRLDRKSMIGDVLHLDITPEEAQDIYDAPLIFRAVVADVTAGRGAIASAERDRIEKRRRWLADHDRNEQQWAEMERKGKLSPQEAELRDRERAAYAAMSPNWLGWSNPLARDVSGFSLEQMVNATLPQVAGSYENGYPFAVQRDIGKGHVVLVTTGLWPSWNTLALENSVLLLDRIMRSLLVRSLPDRTFGPEKEIVIPLEAAEQGVDFAVQMPGESEPRLQSVEAVGEKSYGLVLRAIQQRGLYRVRRQNPGGEGADEAKKGLSTMALAVNGPAEESELASWASQDVPQRIGQTEVRWIDADEKIRLSGRSYSDPDFWKVLMAVTLGCLLLEMFMLTGWRLKRRTAS